jgi:GNAT superfamily N-acetyltransferase
MTSTQLDSSIGEPCGTYVLTRSGTTLRVRPVTMHDGSMLAEFFARLSPEDLRFRFLDTHKMPSGEDIAALLEVDHRRSEHLLAFDTRTGELIASLLLACDPVMDVAEAAIAVASDRKRHGIGWALLQHASQIALAHGVRKLRCVESRDHHEAIEVEQALGFRARGVEGEPTLVLVEAELA